MKWYYFYLYQIADVIFTASSRAIAILFAWQMIQYYQLKVQLGWFMTAPWIGQVLLLLTMGKFADRVKKKQIPIFCSALTLFCLGILLFPSSIEAYQLGIIYLICTLLCIAIQPIGSSIIPSLYMGNDLEHAFKIRGFINSINIVFGAALSGFIIQSFLFKQTITILTFSTALSLILFALIKTTDLVQPTVNHHNRSALKSLLNNKVERVLVLVAALANFVLTPILMYITPILVIEKYHYSAQELGIAEAIFGIGMIFGSLFLCQKLNHCFNVRITTVLSIITVAIGILMISVIQYIGALFLGLLITGTGAAIYNINTTKIRCSATPEYIRNSFESIFLAVCILPIPAGIAITTFMIESAAITQILMLFVLLILLSAVAVWMSKDFKQLCALENEALVDYYPKLYPRAYTNNPCE